MTELGALHFLIQVRVATNLWHETMVDKLKYIPNDDIYKITPYVDYNLWLKRLDTQLKEPTNQKVPKVD